MIVLGVVAAPGSAYAHAERLADSLPEALAERYPGLEWRAEVVEAAPARSSASTWELIEDVRRRALASGWDLAVGLTDLPLHVGRRPVSAHASATHGVGLVSVPALGAVRVDRRLHHAVLRLVDGLVGEAAGDVGAATSGAGRRARIAQRLSEIGSPLGRARVRDDGSVRFVTATLRGNLRLLVGMVRANEPSKLIARLSRVLVAALGTAAFALSTSDVWRLADASGWPRVVALALGSVLAITAALVIAHGLWERASPNAPRERVVLFNLATVITVALGVLTLYLALFAAALIAGEALLPARLLARLLGHPVGFDDYVRLALTAAGLATTAGALGSLVESDLAVRDATYRNQEDERTEAGEQAEEAGDPDRVRSA